MFKLDPLSLTYVITLSSIPKEFNNNFTWFAMVTPTMLCTLKIPIVTSHGSHEELMKLTTIAKVPQLARNIQRSNEHVQVIQDARVRMTQIPLLVLSTMLGTL